MLAAALAATMFMCAVTIKTDWGCWFDLSMRYHEISCAHTGVNPFHIWNRTVESGRYKGLSRPDKPDETRTDDTRATIHAYPPWHTTFFWWYGWLSREVVVTLFLLCSCSIFALAFFLFRRWAPADLWPCIIYWSTLLILMLKSFRLTMDVGNYGCFLLLGSLILFFGMKKTNFLLLGAAWALIMIKPQVGVLFFWPLLFARRYAAIAVAVILCLLATLWPAHVYGESPFELILQVPRLGAPYVVDWRNFVSLTVGRMTGCLGVSIWSVFCFAACGLLSFQMRASNSDLMKFLPVCIFIPIWTYALAVDWLVLWPLYVAMAILLSRRFNLSVCLLVFSIPAVWVCFHVLSFMGYFTSHRAYLTDLLGDLSQIVLSFVFIVQIYAQKIRFKEDLLS